MEITKALVKPNPSLIQLKSDCLNFQKMNIEQNESLDERETRVMKEEATKAKWEAMRTSLTDDDEETERTKLFGYFFSSIPLLLATRTIQPLDHANLPSIPKAVNCQQPTVLGSKNEIAQFSPFKTPLPAMVSDR